MSKQRPLKQRTAGGSSLIELASTIALLSVLIVVCVNISVLLFATLINDQACRDAARAASHAESNGAARTSARAALAAHPIDGYYVTAISIADADVVYQDYAGNPTPEQVPTVQVTTTAQIRLPTPLIFFTAKLGRNGTMPCRATYTFPLTNYSVAIPGESHG